MDYETSRPPPSAKCRHVYNTQDVKSVRVNAFCGVQSLENRFGSGARERIYAHLLRHLDDDDEDAEVSDDESYDEYFTSSDEGIPEMLDANSNDLGNGNGAGHAMDAENDSSNENDNTVDNTGPSENGGVSPEPLIFHNPVPPVNIQVATPTFGTFFTDSAATMHDSPLSDSGENAAQSATSSSGPDAKRHTAIPRAARARVNLTALSQHYNLYFAAYHSEIHVFRPQPAPEILKGPLLILNPPASAAAGKVGGYICKGMAHQVNHLITGDLGGAEILLLAYDDGDIIAYYTRHVVDFLERSTKQQPRGHLAPQTPRPFFHDTVGASAWGLAIHSLSRLIAVSSNRAEVDVFAFALQPFTADDSLLQRDMQHTAVPVEEPSPTTNRSVTLSELERHLRSRDRHRRILLCPGLSTGNIPCIDFISDKDGFAEKVAAIDIHGCITLLDIWTYDGRPIRINPPQGNRWGLGWGILVIPKEMFLPTAKMPVLGDRCMFDRACPSNIDGSRYLEQINESAAMRPDQSSTAYDMTGNESDLDDDTSMDDIDDSLATYDSDMDGISEASEASEAMTDTCDEDHSDEYSVYGDDDENQQGDSAYSTFEACNPATTPIHLETRSGQEHTSVLPSNDSKEATQPFSRLGMIVCPSVGLAWHDLSVPLLLMILKCSKDRGKLTPVRDLTDTDALLSPGERCLLQRFSIIRTFTNGVGVVDTDPTMLSFFIKNVMSPPTLPSTITTLWDMMPGFHRCSLLHMIPEIKLIIVGNMFGRVVLIRALRNSRPHTMSDSPTMALRVEWSLPFARDEQAMHRPPCCLLGIAVSPLPERCSGRYGLTSTKKHRLPERPRRYRLILHYMDHTILQYYIEGSEWSGDRVDVGPI